MTKVIPAGYYEAAFHHNLTGNLHVSVCTFGVHYTGGDFENDIASLPLGWLHIVSSMSDVWRYAKFTLSTQDGVGWESIAGATFGGKAGPAQTANTAWLLKKSTGRAGRRMRGRTYVPGVNESDADYNGLLTGGKLTELNAALANLESEWAAAHFHPVILHNLPENGDPSKFQPTDIEDLYWSPQLATQRKRMRRVY